MGETHCAGKIRALVVDDTPTMLLMMSECLERLERIEVVGTAVTGKQALERCEALHPDLVLLDVQMPEMDGLQAAAVLRRLHPDLKIVVVTGLDTPEMRESARASGVHAFMSKLRLYKELPGHVHQLFPLASGR